MNFGVGSITIVPLVLALLAGASICIPTLVGLASLSISVETAVILSIASVFASLTRAGRARARVRGALGRIGAGVELEAVSGLVFRLNVVARQAGEGDATNGRRRGVSFPWTVWLLANVGLSWDWDTAGGGRRLGARGAWLSGGGGNSGASVNGG